MARISEFIIVIVFISFFMGVFGLFISAIHDNYTGVSGYDNDSLNNYNKLDEMANFSKDIRDSSNIKEKEGLLDVIGGYFSSAYSALKLTATSFDLFTDISEQASEDAALGEVGSMLKVTITTVLIIIIFLGILISAILKWWI